MSAVAAALDALFVVLEEERAALRRIDGKAAAQAGDAKEQLAAQLAAFTPAELAPHAAAIGRLRSELRRNGVLLAHARSCLQHAVDLIHPRRGDARHGSLRKSL